MNDTFERDVFYIWVIFWILVIVITILGNGCTTIPLTPPQPPMTSGTTILWKTIMSTDWLMSMYLIAITCGIFAGLNGIKAGWMGAFACFVGILLKAALSNTWVYVAAGLGLVGCVLLLVVSILLRKKALVEIIKGVQTIKTEMNNSAKPTNSKQISDAMVKEQSKPTQRLVQQIKGKLKVEGAI